MRANPYSVDNHPIAADVAADYLIDPETMTLFEKGSWNGVEGYPLMGDLYGLSIELDFEQVHAFTEGHVDKKRFIAGLAKLSRLDKYEAIMRHDRLYARSSYAHVLSKTRHCWVREVDTTYDDHEKYLAVTYAEIEGARPITMFSWCWTPWTVCEGDCGEKTV